MYEERSECGWGGVHVVQAQHFFGIDGARMPWPTPRLRIVLDSSVRVGSGTPLGRRRVGFRSNPTHLRSNTGAREDRVHSIAHGRLQQECH